MLKSVYIHIPFCRTICSYCDFCKMYYQKRWVNTYLDALEKEIKQNYYGEIIETLYIGGGTPSVLNYDQLQQLFYIIQYFSMHKNVEFTFECNIEDLDFFKLQFLKQHGVNRLSIGIESFQESVLNILNRNKIDFLNVQKLINQAKQLGFENINIDLMYGISGQTLADLKCDLDMMLQLDIPHVSIYSLILEKNTKLFVDQFSEMNEELEIEMYQYIQSFLTDHGYIQYEVSNYSKIGYESKHNLTYWNNLEYYGFGLGASGYIDHTRYTNTRSLTHYLKGEYVLETEILTKKDQMELEMILGLRKIKGVSIADFEKKYQQKITDVFNIETLLKDQKLEMNHSYIYIPLKYLYISNEILVHFLID